MRFILLLIFYFYSTLIPALAFASESQYYKLIASAEKDFNFRSDILSSFQVQQLFERPISVSDVQCRNFLLPLQKKSKITIGYFVGYDNSHRDQVMDNFEKKGFMAFLLSPCRSKEMKICNFIPVPGKPDTYSKIIKNLIGDPLEIEILIQDSSFTSSNSANIQSRDQYVKSGVTRRSFMKSLAEKDVIIYSGHSRYGGGPDFFPVSYDINGEENNSNYYRRHRSGLTDLITGLEQRVKNKIQPPAVLMMSSCDSKAHFSSSLNNKTFSPYSTILTTSAIYSIQAIPPIVGLLGLILNQTCPDRFEHFFQNHELFQNPH